MTARTPCGQKEDGQFFLEVRSRVVAPRSVCGSVYQQVWSFSDPVPGVSRAVVFPCQDDEGNAVSLVAFGRLEDVQLLAQTGRGRVTDAETYAAWVKVS